jgi:hypothetical protein
VVTPDCCCERVCWAGCRLHRRTAPPGRPRRCLVVQAFDTYELERTQRVADSAQIHVGGLGPAAGALLEPEQQLRHHQRGKPAQADTRSGVGDAGVSCGAAVGGERVTPGEPSNWPASPAAALAGQ